MRILPMTYCTMPINFRSKVVEIGRGRPSQAILDEVDKFEETNAQNADIIGEGTTSTAYRLKLFPDCILKMSHPGEAQVKNGDFSSEASSLEMLPDDLENSQKLIGNVRTEKNNWYLLSTYREGKAADGKEIKWDRDSLRSLLDSLAKLDAAQIYHGDVSKNNCLITNEKKVNLIDYQYTRKFDIQGDPAHKANADMYKVPYYLAPSNAMMFEESTFGTYLSNLEGNEAAKLFKEYLQEKSTYHANRARAFQRNGARGEIVDYDNLMAKFLKDPSPEVIDLYARKMQILLIHRNINSTFDGYGDMKGTVPDYLRIIYESNQLRQRADMLREKNQDPDYDRFLYYMSHDGYFWAREMKNELGGGNGKSSAFEWVLNNVNSNAVDENGNVLPMSDKAAALDRPPEIRKHLTGQKVWLGFEREQTDDLTAVMDEAASDLKTSQTFYISINDPNFKEIKNFHEAKKRVLADISKCKELYQDDSASDSIFYLLNAYGTSIKIKETAQNLLERNLTVNQRFAMSLECDFFERYSGELRGLCEELYRRLYEKTDRDDRLKNQTK